MGGIFIKALKYLILISCIVLLAGVSFGAETNGTNSDTQQGAHQGSDTLTANQMDNSDDMDDAGTDTKVLKKTSDTINASNTLKSAYSSKKTRTIYVNPKANGKLQDGSIKKPYSSLETAVSKCLKNYNNNIVLSQGSYKLEKTIQITGTVKILGAGRYKTVIDCNNIQGFRMTQGSNLTFEKVLIQRAKYSQGGAVLITGKCSLNINNCVFRYNKANNGAVVFGSGPKINCSIRNTVFKSNMAVRFGAALHIGGYTSVYNINRCIFENNILNDSNYAHSSGGAAIYASSFAKVNVNGCTFTKNKALTGNAILNGNHATLTVLKSTFTNNIASKNTVGSNRTRGGAIAVGSGYMELGFCNFTGNKADIGGAISINSGERSLIYSCIFRSNRGYTHAGAINNFGDLTVRNTFFIKNNATRRGGAIVDIGTNEILLDNCTFKDNRVFTYRIGGAGSRVPQGGAISISGSCHIFTIKNSFFDHNNAYYGGALYSEIDTQWITVTGTVFKNNTACFGASVYIAGETTLDSNQNTFKYNRALRKGGAIFIAGSVQGNFKKTLFLANKASVTGDGDGGAVYIASYARLMFNYCSFINNSANLKGGAICSMSVVTINIACSNITSNKAKVGSAIYHDNSRTYKSRSSKIRIETSTFIGNSANYVFYSVKGYHKSYNDVIITTSWWGTNLMNAKSVHNFYLKNRYLLTLSLNEEVIDYNWQRSTVTYVLNRTQNSGKDLIVTINTICENTKLRYTDAFLPARKFFIKLNNKRVYSRNLYVYYHLDMSLNRISVCLDGQTINIWIVN